MPIQWIKGSTTSPMVTFYENNITLNNAASAFFADARYALLGIDYENKTIAIKPIKKRELDMKLYDMANLSKVSIGRGYARISNKYFLEEVRSMMNKPLQGLKFEAAFQEHDEMLVADLKKGAITA